nr:hypothetical protein B0A51_04612 [Rachicladosporium sp. CCFEE 5018]
MQPQHAQEDFPRTNTRDSDRTLLNDPTSHRESEDTLCELPDRHYYDMATQVEIERRQSFGRGGAGNIRTKEKAQVVEKVADALGSGRRRSSVLSSITSGSSRRGSIVDKIFRRESKAETVSTEHTH